MSTPSKISPADPPAPVPPELERLKSMLDEATEQRKISYKLVFVVTVIFQNDNTGAAEDATLFATAMKEVLGIRDINVFKHVIPVDKGAPDYWLFNIIKDVYDISASCIGRKLLILHFAGHGYLDGGKLFLAGGPPEPPPETPQQPQLHLPNLQYQQAIPWSLIKKVLLDPTRRDPTGILDVAVVLDCCYSGAFDGPVVPKLGIGIKENWSRTIEVIAATDGDTTTVDRRSTNIRSTFTQRFVYTIRQLAGQAGSPPVTLPRILSQLNNHTRLENQKPLPPSPLHSHQKPYATYRFLSGHAPILLPTTSLQLAPALDRPTQLHPTMRSTWRSKSHYALFQVRLPAEIQEESTIKIINWLYKLPTDFDVEVLSVHESTSTAVFLIASYADMGMLYRLETSGLCKVQRISENIFSRNLLDTVIDREWACAQDVQKTVAGHSGS
ncbi:hypothetical protein TWF481_009342 [Arthrobotrys musiformis]|uniref:Uncharacterized protein n=1 Tax=Arthrobotrys musiformis TaxID=47236 RepID=A0AAV9W4Q5_9PEZI